MLMETMRMELAFDISRRQRRAKNEATTDRDPADTAARALPASSREADSPAGEPAFGRSGDVSPDTRTDRMTDAAG